MILSDLSIQRETIDQFYQDAKELFELDWSETTNDGIKFEIDEAYYRKLEQAGALFIIAARFEGKLIGYIGFILQNSLHHKLKVANSTGLYVAKEYRGRTGDYLIKSAKEMLKINGVGKMRISTSVKNDVSRLFERNGGVAEEIIHGWIL